MLSQGQMVDVCSGGAAFTCYADTGCPYPGQQITTRFSVPYYHEDARFDISDFIRGGQVCRVQHLGCGLTKVALKFHEPLPFKPGELANSRSKQKDIPEFVMV